MPAIAVVGAQWGDEGKGKVVDLLSDRVDIVARYQGGSNAGHTIVFGKETFVLHQIPSGIFRPEKVCVIGTGTVIDPAVLFQELDSLAARGIEVRDRLWISAKAHLIMPYHRQIDTASEARKGSRAIGTTGRGIGWAYTDKMSRQGIRVIDLLDEAHFAEKLAATLTEKNVLLESLYGLPPMDEGDILAEYRGYAERLAPMVADTERLLKEALGRGETILIEGAQGTMLDIDQGTYPYVTSSTPTIGGACAGLGLPPKAIDVVVGVAKAYTTRVGGGPMPTELTDEVGAHLRTVGDEFGSTTGRPRRCGWLDAVVLRHACWVNGLDRLVLTKLDVLDGLERVAIATAYRIGGETVEFIPSDVRAMEAAEPILLELEGWRDPTAGATSLEELPDAARRYVEKVEKLTGLPILAISTGPERSQTILQPDPLLP